MNQELFFLIKKKKDFWKVLGARSKISKIQLEDDVALIRFIYFHQQIRITYNF